MRGGTTNSHQVAFSRGTAPAGGVTNYPDPNSSGVIPKESSQELGVTQFEVPVGSARWCQHLLPNGGNGPNQAQLQRVKAQGLRFAQCMRTHGVALPDPGSDGRIPDPATVGINQGSPQFEAANQACGKYRPPDMPSKCRLQRLRPDTGVMSAGDRRKRVECHARTPSPSLAPAQDPLADRCRGCAGRGWPG